MEISKFAGITGELARVFAEEMNSDVAELILNNLDQVTIVRISTGLSILELAKRVAIENKFTLFWQIYVMYDLYCFRSILLECGVKSGSIALVQSMLKTKFPLTNNVLNLAVKYNNFALVQWLVGDEKLTGNHACIIAAECGHLYILSFLVSAGFKHNGIAEIAAKNGQLDVLIWALERKDVFYNLDHIWFLAITAGHINILEWLHNNRHFPANTIRRRGSPEVDAWLIANGY